MDFRIVDETADYLVVDKPPFLLIHPSKPDGQPRRMLDVTRARELFGFTATTDFRAGLQRTIDWYRAHRSQHPASGTEHLAPST